MSKNILICPLNWGLGHASRCVPIIKSLIDLKQHVIVAADEAPLVFLEKAFPDIDFIKLPGFRPAYSKSDFQVFKLAGSIPNALINFRHDHISIENIVNEYQLDAIISDNRFGCWSKKIPSVFITHQLHIRTPKFWHWTAPVINLFNNNYIKKYNELWIPDFKDEPFLSGDLSHPAKVKIETHYIGFLSRFHLQHPDYESNEKDIDYLVILSGPEPQRTILEDIIIRQAENITGKVVILRAKPDQSELLSDTPININAFNHVDDKLFVNLVKNSKNIICRGGYSSLMDLIQFNRNAFLVPTPGQTEQEYLADILSDKELFSSCKQKDFRLDKIIIPEINLHEKYKIDENFIDSFLKEWLKRI